MSTKLIFSILAGAAVATGIAYLYTTEEGEELRGKIADNINEHFPEAGERFAALKDQVISQIKSVS